MLEAKLNQVNTYTNVTKGLGQVSRKLKYFILKKKLFLYKKIRFLDWTVSYRKKDYKTRIFVTRYHKHMGDSYKKTPVNELQRVPPRFDLSNSNVANWIQATKIRVDWSAATHTNYLVKLKTFKYFKELCEWNRRATSSWYGLKYNKPKLNKFFIAAKNCSKIATHATVSRQKEFLNKDKILNLFGLGGISAIEHSIKLNRRYTYNRLQYQITVHELNVRVSKAVAWSVITTTKHTHYRKRAASVKKLEVGKGKKQDSAEKSQVFRFRWRPYHLTSKMQNRKGAVRFVYSKMVESFELDDVISDFRTLYLRKLPKPQKFKSVSLKSVNLNLFNYRTNNWKVTV